MSTARTHVLAYPFPSSGHVIPLLDFTKALVSRGVQVTLLVAPYNENLVPKNYSPLLQTLLLPEPHFPNPKQNRLMALVTFMRQHHYPVIVDWAKAQPTPPSAIISDFFLGWTHLLARDLHVPRLVFSPSGAFALSVSYSLWRDAPQNDNPEDPNSVVSFPNLPNSPIYPWWQMTHLFRETERGGPEWEFHRENMLFNIDSWGVVFNTFTELERVYLNHMKKELNHERVWAVGPVLPIQNGSTEPEERGGNSTVSRHDIMEWLDSRDEGSVIYVCFGSRTFLTSSQMEVLTRGLELSGVNFILSVRVPDERHVAKEHGKVPCGFSDRVRGRGFIIEGWAPQLVILSHRAVGAFLTHCGWNSVLEGLVSGVVMLTWPMGADQYTNAKLLVDQLGVAVRAAEGEKVPEASELGKRIEKALGRTKERAKAEKLRDDALRAIGNNGGSSQRELDALVKLLNEVKRVESTS
uniref:UGT1 n=1 Tax=Pueraria montana var. lobata TaxID=3893 RepID=C6ZJB2_PUEML|nr:UGT1 [Pueraria montana var. lobata]